MERIMKLESLALALCLTMLVSVPARGDDAATSEPLLCSVGPVEQTYGNTKWRVYSCDDERSVVIVSAPDSPASPFVFRFMAQGEAYLLQSRGTGKREFTAAAFGELKQMSPQDIAALVRLTRARASQ